MLEMLISAFVLGIVVAMPPGAVTIAGGRRAISFGFGTAVFFTMGSTTSDAFYASLVYLGLAPFLEENEIVRLFMWVIGGAWLCWLGYEAMQARIEVPGESDELTKESRWRSYGSGVGITLLNPLTIAGWVALAGNFFASWAHDWPSLEKFGYLAIAMMLAGVVTWFLFLMGVLSSMRHFLSPVVLRRISLVSGVMLLLFGLSAWWSAFQTLFFQ